MLIASSDCVMTEDSSVSSVEVLTASGCCVDLEAAKREVAPCLGIGIDALGCGFSSSDPEADVDESWSSSSSTSSSTIPSGATSLHSLYSGSIHLVEPRRRYGSKGKKESISRLTGGGGVDAMGEIGVDAASFRKEVELFARDSDRTGVPGAELL